MQGADGDGRVGAARGANGGLWHGDRHQSASGEVGAEPLCTLRAVGPPRGCPVLWVLTQPAGAMVCAWEPVQCPGPLLPSGPSPIRPPTHVCQLSLCKWRDFLLFNSTRTR